MRQIILILLLAFISFTSYSQKNEYVFMVLVNNDVNLHLNRFIATFNDGTEREYAIDYLFGRLKINNDDIKELSSDSIAKIRLEVHYYDCKIGNRILVIDDFNINWLTSNTYFILHIYDLKIRKYRKLYYPEKNKDFTYKYIWGRNNYIEKKYLRKKRKDKRCKRKVSN